MKFAAMHKYLAKLFVRERTASRDILVQACLILSAFASVSFGIQERPAGSPSTFGPPALSDHPDAVFIESLINVGLFDLATETCRERFGSTNGIQTNAGAQWTMLLMQSMAAKIASEAAMIDSPESISARFTAIDELASLNEEVPRALWLQYQSLWCRWFVVQRSLAAYLAVPARTQVREHSLTIIRECLDSLEKLQLQIAKSTARNTTNKKGPTDAEWASLVNDTYLLHGDLLHLRALFYPAKSAERIAAASEMMGSLEKALVRVDANWTGRTNIELARCNALIQLDRGSEAIKELESISKRLEQPKEGKQKTSNRWRQRIATLSSEAFRNLGQYKDATHALESMGDLMQSPELAIEHLANLVASQSQTESSSVDLTQALKVKSEIGRRFGNYWQQRADALLVSRDLTEPSSKNKLELLRAEAKQLMAANRWELAIEKLEQVEQSAASIRDTKEALDFAIATAAIHEKLGQRLLAAEKLHRAAMAYRDTPKSAAAALMSVWKVDPNTPRDEFRERLTNIVDTWPTAPESDRAFSMLEQSWFESNELAEIASLWCKRLSAPASPNSQRIDQAFGRWMLIAIAVQEGWLERTDFSLEEYQNIQKLLDQLRQQMVECTDAKSRSQFESAMRALSECSRWPTQEIWTSLASTTRPPGSEARIYDLLVAQDLPGDIPMTHGDEPTRVSLLWGRAELCFQQSIAIGILSPLDRISMERFKSRYLSLKVASEAAPLTQMGPLVGEKLKRSLLLYEAALECWAGNEVAGMAALKVAREAEPRNPWWPYRTARIYQTLPNQRQHALKLFRGLANGFPAGSEAWLESRARTAETMRIAGDLRGANDLSKLVLELYPNISEKWKQRFNP